MIKIKKNINKLIDIFKILQTTNSEADLNMTQEGISIEIIGLGNISMGILNINKDFFEEYQILNKIHTIDVNLFLNILKKLQKNEIIIEIEEDSFKFTSGSTLFKLKAYNQSDDPRKIPEPKFNSIWNIKSTDFFNLITDHLMFSPVAKFEASDVLKTYVKSNLIEGEVIASAEKIESINCNVWYDISNLINVLPIKSIFENLTFSFGVGLNETTNEPDNNKPLPCRIDASSENLKFIWILAPRVAED